MAASTFEPAEFDCCECGQHVMLFSASGTPDPPLCGFCQHIPGWFRSPQLRAVLDPQHDGLEVCEREAPL